MTHYQTMSLNFERQKNRQASAITTVVCGLLFVLFFFLQWTLPQVPVPEFGEGIEVNLGNSETGLGDDIPQIPGEPAANQENAYPPSSIAASQPQSIEGDENADDDAPAVTKTVTNPTVKPVEKSVVKKSTIENKPVPTPPAPKPKAVYAGGTTGKTGGNLSDSYNGKRNQGIVGGKGDQGNPNGNPLSDSYKGNAASGNGGGGGTGGVSIKSGLQGRKFTRLPSFEDEFNENAKVAVDITVDKAGNVTAAMINPRGTTTTSQTIRDIALRKARSLKLNAGATDEQTGTLVFSFKLRG